MDAASSTHFRNARLAVVGRVQECRALARQFENALTGVFRVVMLAGEPGIGKTHLLDWTAQQGKQRGATVLRGGAFQAEGMPPYLPVLEALDGYVRAADPDLLRQQVGPSVSVLAGLFPDLSMRLGDVPQAYVLPPEQTRLRLFEAIGVLLDAIADSAPLLILLDDMQWADRSTLELLCYVARAQPTIRVLVVGAYRDDEALENDALQDALTELTRQRRLTAVRIAPLATSEVGTLAARYLGAPVDPGGVDTLYGQCDGNPFFAEELLQDWIDAGSLTRMPGGWSFVASSEPGIPPSIAATIHARLRRLPPEVVDTLRSAAVIGRAFSIWLLAAIVHDDVEAVEDLVIHGERARLVERVGDGMFRFRHDIIRESLYGDLTDARRRRLHQAIGQALEDGSDTRAGVADLAFHFARSGDRERGIAYARQAGDEALRHSAVGEALAHYQTALDLLGPADERRGHVLLQVGDSALLAGKEEIAVTSYKTAQGLLVERAPEAAARAAHGHGVARLRQDAPREAHVAFDAALRIVERHDTPETVRVLVDLSTLLAVNLEQQEDGVARGRQALDLARQIADRRLEAAAARALGNLMVRGNEIPAGMDLLRDALVLARAEDNVAEVAECCACLANASYWTADIGASRDYTWQRQEAAQRSHQPYELRHIHTWLAFLAATQGLWGEAERLLAEARPWVQSLASAEPLGFLYQIEGFLAGERGHHGRAANAFSAAAALFREHNPGELLWYLGPLGLAQLRAGKRSDAEDTLAEMDALLGAHPTSLRDAPALNCAGLMAVALGDHARAADIYSRLRPFEGQLHWYLVDRTLAACAGMGGRRQEAEEYFERAKSAARRAGMRETLAGIVAERAEYVRDITVQALPGGLSRREGDVIRLVALGMSNREIAVHLHLSENTVAKHLTSIFNKTGSDNRAAAAAFAARHGLAE